MAGFEYKQAEEVRDAFARHACRYLFLGKSGAILLGFPDTTQDTDVFTEKSPQNGARLVAALLELGFDLTADQRNEVLRCKDFVQLRSGPFDMDLVFAPATGSRAFNTHGIGVQTSRDSRSAASKISLRANRRRIERKTESRSRVSSPSAST